MLLCACVAADRGGDFLRIEEGKTSLEGTFASHGRIVRFHAATLEGDEQVALDLDVDGKPLEIILDLAGKTLTEDAYGSRFELEDRALLVALRDAVLERRPAVTESLHGRLLVKAADRFAEVPVGPALLRREVALERSRAAVTVLAGCGDDGVTCLPGTSGSSWAVFSASGVCEAAATAYGDEICRGRCGVGCSWFDQDYTWDCLDHDVCLDYSNDCSDEFGQAADDWVATFAPLCYSGTIRPMPAARSECGDLIVGLGEECDDGNTLSGDGCGSTCEREVPGIVINEVDYDVPGTDDTEFLEIYNGTGAAVDLATLAIVLVNGATRQEYGRIPLGGRLRAGGYLVVCPKGSAPGTCAPAVAVAAGALIINFGAATNSLQNGAPDGVALVDVGRRTLVDSLAYEGALTAEVDDLGALDLVEGTPATVADEGDLLGAMARFPNGMDTGDAAHDWATRSPTPGAPNH